VPGYHGGLGKGKVSLAVVEIVDLDDEGVTRGIVDLGHEVAEQTLEEVLRPCLDLQRPLLVAEQVIRLIESTPR
jgi:hypothetical protein